MRKAYGSARQLTRPPWPTYRLYISYGYNGLGLSAETDTNGLGLGGHLLSWSSSHTTASRVSESEVVSPSEMMAIGDGFMGRNGIIRDGELIMWRNYNVTNNIIPEAPKGRMPFIKAKPTWYFATATSNRRRCNFFLKTRVTPPCPAGTATICRTAKNFRHNSASAKSCGAAHASSPQRELWEKVHNGKSSGRSDRKFSAKTFLPPRLGLNLFGNKTHGFTVGYFLSRLRR